METLITFLKLMSLPFLLALGYIMLEGLWKWVSDFLIAWPFEE